jgi:hypothetical protein
VTGTTAQAHTLTVTANGRTFAPRHWGGVGHQVATVSLSHTILLGALQLDLQVMSTNDRVLLDWIALPDVRPAYPATPHTPVVERGLSSTLSISRRKCERVGQTIE